MTTATFSRDGGPVKATVASGFAQEGSYTRLLWEANANTVVLNQSGNFINADDDTYALPTPNASNDGRIAEALVTIVLAPPLLQYDVSLTLTQDGKELGVQRHTGSGNAFDTVTSDLYVQLVGA